LDSYWIPIGFLLDKHHNFLREIMQENKTKGREGFALIQKFRHEAPKTSRNMKFMRILRTSPHKKGLYDRTDRQRLSLEGEDRRVERL
jgi:hypothetical protein